MDRRLLPESCTRSSACFPEKPLLRSLRANCCLSMLRRWGCVRGLSALGERLAACGHIFSRRGSREAGEPRRGAPAFRPLSVSMLRGGLSYPPIGAANYR